MSLVTRCPACRNDFIVSTEQLNLHDGLVRCGECAKIFDGFAHLENELPTLTKKVAQTVAPIAPPNADFSIRKEPQSPVVQDHAAPAVLRGRSSSGFVAEPEYPPFVAEPEYPQVVAEPAYAQAQVFSDNYPSERVVQASTVSPSAVRGEIRVHEPFLSADRSQPDFLSDDQTPEMLVRVLWSLGSVLALLALIAQVLYLYRNEIVTRVPVVQPLMMVACARLGCEVSLSRHLERISIDASSLQQAGGQAQDGQPTDLKLRFTMRNRYDKSQPWPHLVLELKDASGTTVVRKMIAPHQYLPSSLVDQAFAAGQEVNLSLPIAVSGLQINGFQLDKFFP